ncbi:NAD(P)-dependent oxidoreductase [Mycoavidus sp. B2-EB]|uniref:NAD-dependent epimerase/dehydratase family protein n=1 Tax=Mycoavidus sp. B2-EB TaxID=2651972 RepID=UPI001628CB1C|nr:NAD(P)-dependent oxidoreductase [Mycoavidus sp. B2-EB]BBO59251.1 GDP-6-deoxy-D-lyxo-4-hexulose reductase [Mycoavidus sp. B2-EB]
MIENRVLITGSKGLIGNALKSCLERLGIQVVGMDIDYPTHHEAYGDIRDSKRFEELAAQCIGIVHLAAVSRVIWGERNPKLCWEINVNSTDNMLKTIRNLSNQPWIVYASSREVYGQQTRLPVSEDADLLPLNIYARSKLFAENLVSKYREHGLQTATVRFSSVYGSADDHVDRVIPAFCRVAALGGVMRIEGKDNILDFTHIDDVVDGLIKIIKKLQEGCMDLPTIHFTSGRATTLWQVAELAKRASHYSVKYMEAPSRTFDVSSFLGNPRLAHRLLNWKAKIPLQDGIARLVEQYMQEAELDEVDQCYSVR